MEFELGCSRETQHKMHELVIFNSFYQFYKYNRSRNLLTLFELKIKKVDFSKKTFYESKQIKTLKLLRHEYIFQKRVLLLNVLILKTVKQDHI
jgi:hypothetical protein